MYSVYINHFKRENNIIDTEELMFAVPIINNAYIYRPVVKSNEDAADNFSFTMESNSPYYDAILPYKTTIRVEYDGDVIFWGRALSPSTSSVLHTKTVQCDGSYSFFNDTYYEGVQEKLREKISVSDYFTKVINNHNNMTPSKQIFLGEIGVTLPIEQEKYEPTSWTQTSSIFNELTGNYGGHMRIRYTNGNAYLDWYKYYIRDLGDGIRPSVTIGKNIIDISSEANSRDHFTRVIPIGSTDKDGKTIYIDGYKYKDKDNVEHTYSGKVMPVSFIRNLYTSAQLTDEFHNWTDYRDAEDNYGVIYKTISFSDAETQEKLFDEVKKWIKESYFSIASSFTVKAVDLHIIDGSVPKILFGDCVDVTFLIVINGVKQWVTKKLVCKAVQYDLYNPENNSYTFGIPSDLLDAAGRHKSSKKTASQASGGNKPKPKGDDDEEVTWRKVWQMIGTLQDDLEYTGTNAAMSFYANGELSGTVYCIDPAEIKTGSTAELNQKKFSARLIGKITLSGKTIKWIAISGDRGIFAYTENRYIKSVSYWYSKHKGYKYGGPSTGESTFDKIVKLIEKDTDVNWGGTTVATSFRNNGKINGSANKCYDSTEHTAAEVRENPSLVFSAEIVGKFTLSGQNKYVAVSKEYGVFGFSGNARGLIPAAHWYESVKGLTYDNTSGLISTEDGNVFTTDDGTPDGKKTLSFEPTTLSYPEYDPTKSYAVGAIVTHGNFIYKCKTAISTPEAWNPSHWDKFGSSSQGEAFVGYDLTSGANPIWKIKLNTPIQYNDADGNTQIADGFVSASDFHVQEIPSFKTKIGIFDIVIAGKVEAQTITADLAEVRKWLGDNISVNTWIRTDKLYANNIYSYSDIYLNSAGNNHYQYQLPNTTYRYVDSCLYDVQITESNGTITITLPRLNGSEAASDSFNMADTQFYQDAVSAAWNNGGATAYFTASRTSLEPGQSTTIYAYYTNNSGQAARSYVSGEGQYSSLTISASGGTGGITASDIDIANRGEIQTVIDDPGSNYVTLSALSQAIKNIPSNHHYIVFKGEINGHSEMGTKWYKIPW